VNFRLILALGVCLAFTGSASAKPKPLSILHIGGGCCHEYANQAKLLKKGIEGAVNAKMDVFVEGKDRTHLHSLLKKKNWSSGYDVVIFSICYGHVDDEDFVESVVLEAAKNKKGLVFLHCSLHNFRSTPEKGTEAWRNLMGLHSSGHEKRMDEVVENILPDHPIMAGFPQKKVFPAEEVYIVIKQLKSVVPLAKAYGPKKTKKYHPVIWTHLYKESRIFGTSLGHSTSTFRDKMFIELVTRGTLWTANKLEKDGSPTKGY